MNENTNNVTYNSVEITDMKSDLKGNDTQINNENNNNNEHNTSNNIDINNSNDNDTNINDNENEGITINEDPGYTFKAHITRRVYHVLIFTILPILFYWFADPVTNAINLDAPKLLSFIILFQIIFEWIRIKRRWIIFGMREYERDHVCAQTWGTVSTCIVFLLAFPRTYSIAPVIPFHNPNKKSQFYACYGQIGIPVIWSLGIGDPLLGELKKLYRHNKISIYTMYIIAWFVLTLIYVICYFWCNTSWWLALFMPIIAILAEKPSIPSIDDNGLMLLIPLLFTLLFEPWFDKSCNNNTFY